MKTERNVWIDTHAHLNDNRFDGRIDQVLTDARNAGVQQILVIGIDLATSQQVLALAEAHPELFAVVGIQPNSLDHVQPDDWDRIKLLAKHDRVVGLGETGLDRYWDKAPMDLQKEYFLRHLHLARDLYLPVVIHCREAESDVVEVLEQFQAERGGPISGVMHSFAGDLATAERCLELGLHISFAGMLTFKKSDELRAVAAKIPSERLLVETDSPYLSPHPLRGKLNQPSHVIHTGACLAELHGVPVRDVARRTTDNARELFRLPAE